MGDIQREFQEGADAYGRQLEARHEAERIAAVRRISRYDDNPQLFAKAIEGAFSDQSTTTDEETDR